MLVHGPPAASRRNPRAVSVPAPVDDERRFPHLTALQEAFVVEYVNDPSNAKAAAIAAGYSDASAHVLASRMLRNPVIASAITELTALSLAVAGAKAAKRIEKLIDGAKSEYVQLEAAKDVLTRIGAQAPKRIQVSGGFSYSIDLGE